VETRHTASALHESFEYDPNGNIVRRGAQAGLIYGPQNRLEGGPGFRCRYDGRGNLILLDEAGRGVTRFEYNGCGQLTRVLHPDGTATSFAYDPFGRRIRKRSHNAETRYLWAGDQLIREVRFPTPNAQRPTPNACIDYLYLPDARTPIAMRIGEEVFYLHTDHRDAPTRVSDADGRIVWEADYAAFGEARVRGTLFQPFRLPGQYFDAETGLHYNRARYYHPGWGRYLTPDPLGLAGGWNPYLYADNDPINQVDPLGMKPNEKGKEAPGARIRTAVAALLTSLSAAVLPPQAAKGLDAAAKAAQSLPKATTATPKKQAVEKVAARAADPKATKTPLPPQGTAG
jgi:RHS repeat-associated protein